MAAGDALTGPRHARRRLTIAVLLAGDGDQLPREGTHDRASYKTNVRRRSVSSKSPGRSSLGEWNLPSSTMFPPSGGGKVEVPELATVSTSLKTKWPQASRGSPHQREKLSTASCSSLRSRQFKG